MRNLFYSFLASIAFIAAGAYSLDNDNYISQEFYDEKESLCANATTIKAELQDEYIETYWEGNEDDLSYEFSYGYTVNDKKYTAINYTDKMPKDQQLTIKLWYDNQNPSEFSFTNPCSSFTKISKEARIGEAPTYLTIGKIIGILGLFLIYGCFTDLIAMVFGLEA